MYFDLINHVFGGKQHTLGTVLTGRLWTRISPLLLTDHPVYRLSATRPPISRVSSLKVPGVTISSQMLVSEHVSTVISSCAKSIYALRTLRSHGMDNEALYMIDTSVIIAKLLYAASAWWGFTDRQRLEALIKRGIRFKLCGADVSSLAELVDSADDALFQRILYNSNHVLHSLLPDLSATGHYLRHRRHDRVLPPKTGILQINNFYNYVSYTTTRINTHSINYICHSFTSNFSLHVCLFVSVCTRCMRFVIFFTNEY